MSADSAILNQDTSGIKPLAGILDMPVISGYNRFGEIAYPELSNVLVTGSTERQKSDRRLLGILGTFIQDSNFLLIPEFQSVSDIFCPLVIG
jgi:hypothetical protein